MRRSRGAMIGRCSGCHQRADRGMNPLPSPFTDESYEELAGWLERRLTGIVDIAGGEEKKHRRWSPKITPAVRAIHAYWIPHRIQTHRAICGDPRET